MTDGDMAILGAILFLAFKGRLAEEWALVRKHFFWRWVNAWKRRRYIREKNGNA